MVCKEATDAVDGSISGNKIIINFNNNYHK